MMLFQSLTCIRGLLLVPEGQTILAQQFIAGKGSACRMSAVGTAEYPSEFRRTGTFSRPSGTERLIRAIPAMNCWATVVLSLRDKERRPLVQVNN